MAASDNLSRTQFWPMEKVGQLQSGNVRGMTVEQEYQHRKAGTHPDIAANDSLRAERKGFGSASEYLGSLANHIASNGLVNGGTHRDDGDGSMLTSGAHRYTALRDLGWKNMPMREWDGGDSVQNQPVNGWGA